MLLLSNFVTHFPVRYYVLCKIFQTVFAPFDKHLFSLHKLNSWNNNNRHSLSCQLSEPAKICNITGVIGTVIYGPGTSSPFTRTYHDNWGGGNEGLNKSDVRMDLSKASSLFTNDTDTLNPDSILYKFVIKY